MARDLGSHDGSTWNNSLNNVEQKLLFSQNLENWRAALSDTIQCIWKTEKLQSANADFQIDTLMPACDWLIMSKLWLRDVS